MLIYFKAIGAAAYFTSAYAILVDEWRGSRLSMALGVYELFTGLGIGWIYLL